MNARVTLWDVLFEVDADIPDAGKNIIEATEKVRGLRKRLESRGRGAGWPGAGTLIADTLKQLLNIGIEEDIFIKVWNDAKLFRKYLDPENYPSEETIEIPLLEHTVTSVHRPAIEIRVNEVLLDTIDVEIAATLEIEGAVVEIQGGRIRKLRSGKCTAKAEVKVEGMLLASEKFKPVKLPGVREFDGGIAIAA
jgi:hypothetical protein